MTFETALTEFLEDLVTAAAEGEVLDGCAVHSNFYQPIETERGIRVGDAAGQIGPRAGTWKEFNVRLQLQIFVRVDNNDFAAAGETTRAIGLAVAQAIQSDQTLGGRICDCQLFGEFRRGWAKVSTSSFAAQQIGLLFDQFK